MDVLMVTVDGRIQKVTWISFKIKNPPNWWILLSLVTWLGLNIVWRFRAKYCIDFSPQFIS